MSLPLSPRESAGYIPWWLLAIVAALFVIAAVVLVSFVMLTRPVDLQAPTATALVLTVPPSSPVVTGLSASPSTPISSEPPTATPPPPPAGEVKVGSYVQVTGTGETGVLNLRAEPSLDSPVNYIALEREVLQVQAGPTEANGFVWWYLVDPATNTKYGWAVQNYLQVVQGP